ncbi:MAG: sterol desaturase family protein [Cyclobacteriaceae bacterium]
MFSENYDTILVAGFMLLMGVLEGIGGLYRNSKRTKDDWWIEILSFFHASAIAKPLVIFASTFLMTLALPGLKHAYSHLSLWISFPIVILMDDFIQYWYHRKAHEWKWLWNFHRPHHTTPQMGVLVTFRENIFYILILPNLWWLGVATYLGMAEAVILGVTIKYFIIVGAHSNVRWDQWLYKYSFLHPVAWIIERTISTPSTHFAHHGKTAKDGISNPTGNFSNMFFFWDIIFGTALITRKYPLEFGIENDPKDHWAAHLYWPIIKSDKRGSEIGDGYIKSFTQLKSPHKMTVIPNKNYWYCSCGYSTDQPFCNGSHNGTKYKPLKVAFQKEKIVSFCTCKKTNTAPYCDGSHKNS